MGIAVKITNDQMAFLTVSTVIVFVLLGVVGAYDVDPTIGDPTVMGHSLAELNLSPLYIDSATGRVGIGTIVPSQKLDVDGAIQLGSTSVAEEGVIRYLNNRFEGYNGSVWTILSGGSYTGGGDGGGFTASSGCGITNSPDYFDGLSYDDCDQGPDNYYKAFDDCVQRGGVLPTFNHYYRNTVWNGGNKYYWTSSTADGGNPAVAYITTAGTYSTGSWDDRIATATDVYWRCIGTIGGGGSGGGFGGWVDMTSDLGNNIGPAATDGIIIAYSNVLIASEELIGYSDDTSAPSVIRARERVDWGGDRPRISITMPVKKNDYWRVTVSGNKIDKIWWIPIISGGGSLWSTDGTDVWRETGNVGIGTTGGPSAKLDVVGDIVASGTICDSGGANCIGSGGVSSPACTFCRTCGGDWPSYQGTFVDYSNIARYRGNACSGAITQHTDMNNPRFCCK